MREIKFRAWNGSKKWMSSTFSLVPTCTLEGDDWGGVYVNGQIDDNFTDLKVYENKWAVMQYTGLKDKNGKEIYEGDIVDARTGPGMDRYIVCFDDLNAGFSLKRPPHHGADFPTRLDGFVYYGYAWADNLDKVAVLGNIYENPELLGDKN